MRKLMVAAFVSLDGVMQAPGGPREDPTGGFTQGGFTQGGWTVGHADESIGRFIGGMHASPFDLLLGRKTYETFAAHWPFMPADDPIAGSFNAATKYVATSSAPPLTWANSMVLTGDVAAEIARLKQAEGPILLTWGSSVLLQTLLAHDLIDEFRLLTYPLVLGPGKRLFGQGAKPGALEVVETTVSPSGVVMGVYRPAGAIKTGSFENLPAPSDLEIARRERMEREG